VLDIDVEQNVPGEGSSRVLLGSYLTLVFARIWAESSCVKALLRRLCCLPPVSIEVVHYVKQSS